jgi:hypothetical protein
VPKGFQLMGRPPCLVHGYATLCIEANLERKNRRRERARLFARIISQ